MNDKKDKSIILNTIMVKAFVTSSFDYSKMTSKFAPTMCAEKVDGCKYVHALLFASKEERDAAFNELTEYKSKKALKYPFFYRGEDVTSDMISELSYSGGDFRVWEKYFKDKEEYLPESEKEKKRTR